MPLTTTSGTTTGPIGNKQGKGDKWDGMDAPVFKQLSMLDNPSENSLLYKTRDKSVISAIE
jgi:hypothetical protein